MSVKQSSKKNFCFKISYMDYCPLFRIYDGTTPGLIVGEPRLIREIMTGTTALEVFTNRRAVKTTHPIMSKFLSSLEDEPWKRVRSTTTPTFSSGKLKSIIPIMTSSAGPMLSTLASSADNQEAIDVKLLFGNYTMDIIARSAFATNPDDYFVSQASKLFTFPFWRKFLDYVIPMRILEFFRFTVLPHRPMQFFRRITEQAIAKRKRENIEIPDFLQLLMKANVEGVTGSKHLSEEEILSQSVLFFSVGYETSSQLLAYAAYCLALNPEVQEKTYLEVKEAFLSNSGKIDHGILSKLIYTKAVIDETLRLYNPVLRMERRAGRDFHLEGTGITIPKGMIVGIPVWALHHAKEYYPEPDAFKPERFLAENRHEITPGTYLPFGDGPRNCIGSRFALLECQLALVEILVAFKFVKTQKTKVPLEFYPTGRPLLGPKGIFVGVERRSPI